MKNKIFLIIYIVLAAALTYWIYPIIKDRYFSPTIEIEESGQDQSDSYEIDLDEIEEDENAGDGEENGGNETDEFLEITHEDCKNNCTEFEEESDLRYCRQVCGLAPTKEISENNCDNLTGLEKDYCLKNIAVAKKDFNICQEIKDKNIRETCRNRITEEILNGS